MKRLVLLLALAGCGLVPAVGCASVPADYLEADRATRDAVMPALLGYTQAEVDAAEDDEESDRAQRSLERRQRLDRAWEARLEAAAQ